MTPSRIEKADLLSALARDELVFHYQPKVSLLTGRLVGVEALLRWPQPDGSMILPGAFIPQAESEGYITEISRAMFPRLVGDLMIIRDLRSDIEVAFNLSAHDFEQDSMTRDILDAVAASKIDPAYFQIELTEAAILNGSIEVRRNLHTLVNHGVRLAMDDYGTGYSSIDTLGRWPFSAVKVDHGLISRVLDSEKVATIVLSSIRMAHELGMEVVAEGIETAQVFKFLQNSGCGCVQGFWLAEPMPLGRLLSYLRQDVRWEGVPSGLIHMAQMDHIQWRKTLIDTVTMALYDPARKCAPVGRLEMDHHDCMLGRWYYGYGSSFLGMKPFDSLEAPHRELHEVGRQLLDRCRNQAEVAEIVGLMRSMTRLSGQVLSLLQELENELALQPHIDAGRQDQ